MATTEEQQAVRSAIRAAAKNRTADRNDPATGWTAQQGPMPTSTRTPGVSQEDADRTAAEAVTTQPLSTATRAAIERDAARQEEAETEEDTSEGGDGEQEETDERSPEELVADGEYEADSVTNDMLREELKNRDKPTSGTKEELVKRLRDDDKDKGKE